MRRERASVMLAIALSLSVASANAATNDRARPTLNTHVARRARVFSAGMDPLVESRAWTWFSRLGFYALRGESVVGAGAWGGFVGGADARLATSACADGTVNASAAAEYDYVGWLPVASEIEDLVSAYPDSKVVLFETMVTEWWTHAEAAYAEAAKLGTRCGCGGARSASSQCGDASHHYCDTFPCLWNRAFGSDVPEEETWKRAYVSRVREIKEAVPSGRLLVVPMTGATISHHTAYKVSKSIAQFLGISDDPDAFAAAYPFAQPEYERSKLSGAAIFWLVLVSIASVYVVWFADSHDPARKFLRRSLRALSSR